MKFLRAFFVASLVLGFGLSASLIAEPTTAPSVDPAKIQSTDLVIVQRGNIPLILSAPHGGKKQIPGADKRTGANIPKKVGAKTIFTTALDENVDLVAQQLATDFEKRTGKRPYFVIAKFSRQYCDANRPPEEAYESDAAKAVYDQYHSAVNAYREEILKNWNGRGFLIDVHGQGRDREAIIRGTADWKTVTHLVNEFGKEAVTGPEGLLGPIESAGNKITPPNEKNDEEEYAALNGGYIVRHYGSMEGGTFDAIQFELGGKYRNKDNIQKFSNQVCDSLVPFMKKYIMIGEAKLEPAGR